jgi:hypothetical protein
VDYKYDVFVISPVRNLTSVQSDEISHYINGLVEKGKTVYWPALHTNQNDNTYGYNICAQNRRAMEQSKEVHIYWDKTSEGSKFDLGIAFGLRKNLVIINLEDVEPENYKSFGDVIVFWEMLETP